MSQKPHLDEFFAAARREEPVISHEEIGELIDGARHTHAPITQHITWKGIGMTTVGFGLAAVLSYFAFFSPSNEQALTTTGVRSAGPAIVPPDSRSVERSDSRSDEPKRSTKHSTLRTLVTPATQDVELRMPKVETPIKVDEVRIVEPKDEDMKRLGMKIDGRGSEVVVVQKVGKKYFVVSYAAKPFRVSSQLEIENPTDIDPTETLPVFVTNLDGTGILTASAPDENTTITTSELHSTNEDGKKERTLERTRTNIMVNTDDEDVDVDVSTDFEVEVPRPVILEQHGYNYQTNNDSMVATAIVDGAKSSATTEISVDVPEKRTKVLIKSADGGINIDASTPDAQRKLRIALDEAAKGFKIVGIDSGMTHKKTVLANIDIDSLRMNFQSFKMDSITQLAKDIQIKVMMDTNMQRLFKELHSGKLDFMMEKNAKVRKEMAKELDLAREHMAKMKGLKFDISDSIHDEIHKAMEELRNVKTDVRIEDHLPNGEKHVIKVFGPVHGAKGFVVPGFGALRAQINELVPVRIHLDEAKGKGLIFWYEPNQAPQVAKQETQAGSTSMSIGSVAINPNPAQNHATVRFTMKDARAVTISVHDILGKRLLEAGQVDASAGGEFSRELDLSTLSQGVYLVVLTADNGEQRIERILVNK